MISVVHSGLIRRDVSSIALRRKCPYFGSDGNENDLKERAHNDRNPQFSYEGDKVFLSPKCGLTIRGYGRFVTNFQVVLDFTSVVFRNVSRYARPCLGSVLPLLSKTTCSNRGKEVRLEVSETLFSLSMRLLSWRVGGYAYRSFYGVAGVSVLMYILGVGTVSILGGVIFGGLVE